SGLSQIPKPLAKISAVIFENLKRASTIGRTRNLHMIIRRERPYLELKLGALLQESERLRPTLKKGIDEFRVCAIADDVAKVSSCRSRCGIQSSCNRLLVTWDPDCPARDRRSPAKMGFLLKHQNAKTFMCSRYCSCKATRTASQHDQIVATRRFNAAHICSPKGSSSDESALLF